MVRIKKKITLNENLLSNFYEFSGKYYIFQRVIFVKGLITLFSLLLYKNLIFFFEQLIK